MLCRNMNFRSGVLVLLILALFSGGIGLTADAAELKVGTINTARILSESAYGKRLQAEFAEALKTQRLELDKKRQEVEKRQERLTAAETDQARESVIASRRDLFEKSLREFQWLKSDLDKKLKEMDQAFIEDMRSKIQVVLAQYVENTDYAVIFELGRVAAASSRVDVTSDIIRLMDRRFR